MSRVDPRQDQPPGPTRLRVASSVTKDHVRELKNPSVTEDFKVPRNRDATDYRALCPARQHRHIQPTSAPKAAISTINMARLPAEAGGQGEAVSTPRGSG
jgi:hypothetical protein